MRPRASILLNLVAAIEIPLLSILASNLFGIEPSAVALVLTFLWFLVLYPILAGLVVLIIPYSIGVFAVIYQAQLDFNLELVERLIVYGDRSIVNPAVLSAFVFTYCPLLILGFSLSSRLKIVDDLCRYRLWRFNSVRRVTGALMRLLVLIDAGSEYIYRLKLGLKSRYIELENTRQLIRNFSLWAPPLFARIILSELQRAEYLQSTGIALHKVQGKCSTGLWISEIFAIIILATTVSL